MFPHENSVSVPFYSMRKLCVRSKAQYVVYHSVYMGMVEVWISCTVGVAMCTALLAQDAI